MPNIMIIGFGVKEAEAIREKIDAIMERWGKGGDAVTTIVEATTKWCNSSSAAPYLLVRHTSLQGSFDIAQAIHDELNLDVEYEKIEGFKSATPSG